MRTHVKKKENERSNQTVTKTVTQVMKYIHYILVNKK